MIIRGVLGKGKNTIVSDKFRVKWHHHRDQVHLDAFVLRDLENLRTYALHEDGAIWDVLLQEAPSEPKRTRTDAPLPEASSGASYELQRLRDEAFPSSWLAALKPKE